MSQLTRWEPFREFSPHHNRDHDHAEGVIGAGELS